MSCTVSLGSQAVSLSTGDQSVSSLSRIIKECMSVWSSAPAEWLQPLMTGQEQQQQVSACVGACMSQLIIIIPPFEHGTRSRRSKPSGGGGGVLPACREHR